MFVLGKKKNRFASLARAKGIEKNILAKKSIQKIIYAPNQITFSFYLQPDYAPDADSKNYAPENYTHAPDEKNGVVSQNEKKPSEFGKFPFISQIDGLEIFDAGVPNVIHAAKLLNLPARRAEAQK